MALITAAAVVVGLVVVVLASGVLSPKATVGTLLKPLRPAPVSLIDPANPRALGQASAPVTVEIWSDFQCPACDEFATVIEPDLASIQKALEGLYEEQFEGKLWPKGLLQQVRDFK